MTIKKSLTDEGEETSIKVDFDGTENLFEVKEKLQTIIAQNKDLDTSNGTDKYIDDIASGRRSLVSNSLDRGNIHNRNRREKSHTIQRNFHGADNQE